MMDSYVPFHLRRASTRMGLLCMLLFVTACGSGSPASSPAISTDSGVNVRVLSTEGIHCKADLRSPLPATLILDTKRLDYDSITIQKMAAYVDDGFLGVDLPSPPPGFALVQVALPQSVASWNSGQSAACEWSLQITNMDDTKVIQLSQLQMHLHPQLSRDTYRLVNICSLPLTASAINSCPPGATGSGVNYTYHFDLGTDSRGDRVSSGKLTGDLPLNPTMAPGKTVEVDALFNIAPGAGHISYVITPEITVDLPGESHTLLIKQLQTKITVARPQQLSCYTLNGSTFVPLAPTSYSSAWCV